MVYFYCFLSKNRVTYVRSTSHSGWLVDERFVLLDFGEYFFCSGHLVYRNKNGDSVQRKCLF